MTFKLIKEAVIQTKYSPTKLKTLTTLEKAVGDKRTAHRIFESYQISSDDYSKWLDVIIGYASENNLNIKSKNVFLDTAFAVLENDPAGIDYDMQEHVAKTLWANYKAKLEHSKVEKAVRAKEEEEQLTYAIKKMKRGQEEEQQYDHDSFEQDDIDYIDKNSAEDSDEFDEYEDFDDEFDSKDRFDDNGDRDLGWDDEDEFDNQIISRGKEMDHSRDLEDFDPESDEDKYVSRRGNEMQRGRDLEDFDVVSRQPRRRYSPTTYQRATEQEEIGSYESPFRKDQLVTYKKDGSSYTVAIPDGPGDQVGILMGDRIKMVPYKDIDCSRAKEEEESTSKRGPTKHSFLHDVLTGEKTREHLTLLQKEIENQAANAWTEHHAKMPKNPHPKGSIAYKSWEKGISTAAKEVWAPKPVLDPKNPIKKPKNNTRKK
ncbi:MAG: hypothetical protein ACXW2E_01600 [Nitrososphaeraceae archaeon]